MNKGFVRLTAAVCLAALAASALVAQTRGVDAARILAAADSDWLTYGRTYSEQRFSPLNQINADTVGRLGLAWWAELDSDRGQEATPIIADGVLYTTTAWSKVKAYDATTGKELWSYDPVVDPQSAFNACCDVVNRGVAIWGDKVYVGALDGRLIALNAKTGEEAWSVQTTDPKKPYTITGAPRVVKGKVLIGNGGAEYGVRGYITAYDAATGKQAWRFYTTPNPEGKADGAASDAIFAAKANATWSGNGWKESGGGGTVWDNFTYDPDLDLLYVGVGNGSPWNHIKRSDGKGDNLFLSSIVALKPDSGEYVWHYQTTPGDSWDYTAVQSIVSADLTIGGQKRRVIMQAPKNGFFYVLDAKTGQLLSADKYVPVNWAERVDLATGRPVEAPGVRYASAASRQIVGPLGGHNWQPMAYNPPENLMFIPAMISRGNYSNPADYKFEPGIWNTGMDRIAIGPNSKPQPPAEPLPASATAPALGGQLIAWDPVAKQARWSVRLPISWTSGVLTTGGGLVFHAAGPEFTAYSAKDGKKLWSHMAGANIIAPAATYQIKGVQYVAVMVGWGGAGALSQTEPRRTGRLLVFKLDGKAQARPYRAPAEKPVLSLAAAEASSGDADKGAVLFRRYCTSCHTAGGYLPNLQRSPAILTKDDWGAVVNEGILADGGMISFSHWLNEAQVEDIRAYMLWVLAGSKPGQTASTEAQHPQ